MPIPVQNDRDQRRPCWSPSTTGCVSAFVYGCVFAAANVFPYGFLQSVAGRHGWPFAYMLREDRVPGDLTVYYGPWPWQNPPLVWFRPTALLLDILAGAVLMCLAAVLTEYWLRLRPDLLQPTRGRVIGLALALAGCLCLVEFSTGMASRLWKYAALFCYNAQWLAYSAPILLAVTLAHWLVLRSTRTEQRRRWFGIHWLTWLTLGVFTASFLHYCLFTHTWCTYVQGTDQRFLRCLNAYGWPFQFMGAFDGPSADRLRWLEEGYPVSCFSPWALVADASVWFAVLAMAGFITERWIRRIERGVQIHWGAILAFGLAGIVTVWIEGWDDSFRPAWYDYPSWLFGIACTIYAIELLIIRGAVWSLTKFQRAVAPATLIR